MKRLKTQYVEILQRAIDSQWGDFKKFTQNKKIDFIFCDENEETKFTFGKGAWINLFFSVQGHRVEQDWKVTPFMDGDEIKVEFYRKSETEPN